MDWIRKRKRAFDRACPGEWDCELYQTYRESIREVTELSEILCITEVEWNFTTGHRAGGNSVD